MFRNHPGVHKIPAMDTFEINQTDGAIVLDVGGRMISKALFQFRKETLKGEPIF